MRRSGWLFLLAPSVLWVAAVLLPGGAALWTTLDPGGGGAAPAAADASLRSLRDPGALLLRGAAWSASVAVAALLVGWGPGRLVRRAFAPGVRERGAVGTLLAAATLAPLCLPAYLVSWCWWQAFPPGSPLADWVIHSGAVLVLRGAILWLGLVCWSWALVAWSVAALGRDEVECREAMAMEGASLLDRLRLAWVEDGRGLLVGALAAAAFVLTNTTAFDLAQIRSFGFELRTLEARGASVAEVVVASAPASLLAVAAAALLWRLAAPSPRLGAPGVSHPTPSRAALVVWTTLAVLLGAATPLALMLARLPVGAKLEEFFILYGDALAASLLLAAATGALAGVVAIGVAVASLDERRAVRAAVSAMGVTWLAMAALPAMVVAVGFIAAYNRPGAAGWLYDHPVVVALAHLACFGFAGVLIGRHAASRVDADWRDLRRLDGAGGLVEGFRSLRPVLMRAGVSSAVVAAAFSFGDVVVAGRLQPPGTTVLATSVLNAVHYQDPETVMLAAIVMLALALGAAAICAALLRAPRPGAVRAQAIALLAATLATAVLGGCGELGETTPVPAINVFGAPGLGLGQFDYPRAIGVDAEAGLAYVIDKTARVQRFSMDGTPQLAWQMPEWELGKPTGVSVGPDGVVWVADTHYHRVIAFDRDGRELRRFGEYGTGEGQFVYPTDVAIGRDGRLYVSEYGGNDRVQVFTPEGRFLFAFGRQGGGQGEFSRPQSLAFSPDGRELYVADSCNHRIVATDPEGQWLRSFGHAGAGPGDLCYPYGLHVLQDGSILVAEFGGNRVQRLSPEGRSLGAWGGGGFVRGRLRFPWGVAGDASTILVLDSGNSRIQAMRCP